MAVEDPQCFPRQLRNVFQVPGTPAHRQTRQRRRIDPLIGPAVPIARPPGRYSDPAVFFGCAETLSRYFDSVTCEEDNNCTENQSLFCGSPGAAPPTISMAAYAERLCQHLGAGPTVSVCATIYAERLRSGQTQFVVTKRNKHRLMLLCYSTACKFLEDKFFVNKYVAKVGGVRVDELNTLEGRLLELLGWELFVTLEEYNTMCDSLWLLMTC